MASCGIPTPGMHLPVNQYVITSGNTLGGRRAGGHFRQKRGGYKRGPSFTLLDDGGERVGRAWAEATGHKHISCPRMGPGLSLDPNMSDG